MMIVDPVYQYSTEDMPASRWAIADEYHDVQNVFKRAPEPDVESATHIGLITTLRSRFLPIAATLFLAGGVPAVDTRRLRYGFTSATQLIDPRWHIELEMWTPEPELVTNEQVRALNALLALPYVARDVSHILADE